MFKSQLEPPSENFVETQIFVENIFDTVKKAREAKAARSLAESKLAHYDYSFDFSPSKRKKPRKNAKCKTPKNVKNGNKTPKKKPRKPRTPKESAEKKKKPPTTPKTPRKYTKRAKVKPQNDIDDEEAAFILSSISQRSFDSFYNRFNGTTQVVNKIQIPLETSTTIVQPASESIQQPSTPPKSNHLTAYHHVLLDHNYWIVEPPVPPASQAPLTPTSTVVVTNETEKLEDKLNNESQTSMNLLLTVASHELSSSTSSCTQNSSTNSIKVEVNNNKLPLLDVNCDIPKLSTMSDDNAVKKRWLRQATTECSTPSPTVTPPETSPNDMKAPLKKRRVIREIDDNNEIKIGVCSETESSKIDQTTVRCFESNNFKNNVEAIKFNNNNNNNFVNNSTLLKCEPTESVNINLREIHEKIEMEFGRRQPKSEQNVVVVKEEPRSVIQSSIGHQLHGVKNNLTYGIQMNSPVDVNAIYGRSQPENLVKVDQQRNLIGNEGKLPHTPIYDEKLIKIEPHEKPHDYRPNNINIVEVKFNDKIPQVYGMKTEHYDNTSHAVKPEIYEQKQIKLESPISDKIFTVDGKLQQILDGKIQKIYRDNSQYFVDPHADQKVQFYGKPAEPSTQMSVIKNLEEATLRNQMENIQKQNHIIIHTGSLNDKHHDGYPKIHQSSPTTKLNQLKGLSSPTKIQISPTRTYEIYTKNPHENIAESLLKLQQESPVKLLQMSPMKVIHSPNYQVAQALTFETSTDHGYQKKMDENSTKKLKKTQKVAKIKTKTPKVKKTPMKAKKAQQKPKKVKTPKSPSKNAKTKKNSAKIDKNLIKNFGNLEDVPLKIRQNLAFEEKIMMKTKDPQRGDEKILPIIGLIPPFDSKFQQIGGKIMQIDGKIEQNGGNLGQNGGQDEQNGGKSEQNGGKFNQNVEKIKQNGGQEDQNGGKIKQNGGQEDQNGGKIKQNGDQEDQNGGKTKQNGGRENQDGGQEDQNGGKLGPHEVNLPFSATKPTQTTTEVHKNDVKPQQLQNHVSDTKLLEALSKIHGSDEKPTKSEIFTSKVHEIQGITKFEHSFDPQHPIQNDNNTKFLNDKSTKRTISESSSGSSKTSTCSSKASKSSKTADKTSADHSKSQSKKALKKLKFDDSESAQVQKLDECETKLKNLMEDPSDQHAGTQPQINHQHLATMSNFQTIKDNYAEKLNRRTISESSSVSSRTLSCHSPENTPNMSFVHLESPILAPKAVQLEESQKIVKIQEAKEELTQKGTSSLKRAQESPKKASDGQNLSELPLKSRKLSLSSLKSPADESEPKLLDTVDGLSSCGSTAVKATPEISKTPTNDPSDTSAVPETQNSTSDVKIPENDVTTSPSEIQPSTTLSIHSTSSKPDDDIIKTIIEPPSILKSLSDGIAPIKPIIDSLIPFKSTIESLIDTTKSNSDLLSDLNPEKVVEQQVASILEKVIPKTLKTDFTTQIDVDVGKNEPETEPIESDLEMDDEDDTPYRESVEEFHKDTLEKLMEANKRFYRVHNPFKHSVSYDGRDSGRYSKTDDYHSSRGGRNYDYDDHRKPLKMSLSFESQYSHHNNYSQPHYQRSISEVFNDPRKERWCNSGNGIYENRNYGSFHYDKIHHREPITTTYSMYRAQKASQMESRWGSRPNYEYQQEAPLKVNNYVAEKSPMTSQPQPVTPAVINSYRPIQPIPEPIRCEPAVSPQAEALKNATSEPFGFLKDAKLNVASPAAILPKTKTASHDPRLNPSLVQDVKKEETSTPKKKLSLDQYRKRKSLTNVTQTSPTDEIMPSISVSLTESPPPTLSPAFDPSIAAAAATG